MMCFVRVFCPSEFCNTDALYSQLSFVGSYIKRPLRMSTAIVNFKQKYSGKTMASCVIDFSRCD